MRASFVVTVPGHHATDSIDAVLHVAVGGIPIGEIEFKVSVVQTVPVSLAGTPPLTPGGDRAINYKNAFISYCRKDFDRVSFFAQGLAESGAKACVDITELEPGDEWAHELPRLIEQADVVYVMWSDNAAKSDWVVKETRHAVDLHNAGPAKRPRIKPIPLHQPWPTPPEHLKGFHFYSEWQAHRTAQGIGLFHQTEGTPKHN